MEFLTYYWTTIQMHSLLWDTKWPCSKNLPFWAESCHTQQYRYLGPHVIHHGCTNTSSFNSFSWPRREIPEHQLTEDARAQDWFTDGSAAQCVDANHHSPRQKILSKLGYQEMWVHSCLSEKWQYKRGAHYSFLASSLKNFLPPLQPPLLYFPLYYYSIRHTHIPYHHQDVH